MIRGLEELGIVTPTEVQKKVIPFLLTDRSDLIARATNDVDRVVFAAGEGVLTLVDSLVMGCAVLIVMSTQISWQLTLLALLPMPVMALACSYRWPLGGARGVGRWGSGTRSTGSSASSAPAGEAGGAGEKRGTQTSSCCSNCTWTSWPTRTSSGMTLSEKTGFSVG